jgi:arylformamidase
MARILDISAPLSPRLAVWPGDVGFQRHVGSKVEDGALVTVSSIRTTLHAGTHADAPSHILKSGESMAEVGLEPYLGLCQVIQVSVPPGEAIRPEHLGGGFDAPRVLLRTDSYPDCEAFTPAFNHLSPELVHWLHARGCLLVGLDTPSVDGFSSETLEAHRALMDCGIRCLEGLRLQHIPPGCYDLVALPLRIEGGDGSPVRAVLVAR